MQNACHQTGGPRRNLCARVRARVCVASKPLPNFAFAAVCYNVGPPAVVAKRATLQKHKITTSHHYVIREVTDEMKKKLTHAAHSWTHYSLGGWGGQRVCRASTAARCRPGPSNRSRWAVVYAVAHASQVAELHRHKCTNYRRSLRRS